MLAALGGCGSPRFEDLEQPAVWWQESNGLCAVDRAVDGGHKVWLSSVCEADAHLSDIGTATPEAYARVLSAADLLPRPPPPVPDCGGGLRHRFQLHRGGELLFWMSCGRAGTKLGDLTGLEEPYLSLATAIKALP